ncbi:MAG: 23S rRNA (adenine(2503)-C(2))-methyltransferase RlmN, partial [candidate division Zixibacteria bacterium]|nr:23S rRNA (adenine(2503)-C(2))-methyltransferase RlmN [candidate division Zixibacteria bacterium]
AKQFVSLIHGIPCKINLIRYNPIEANNLKAPDEKAVNEFREYLYPRTPAVTLRESKGSKIAAACGQLRGKYATGKE